MNDKRQLIKKPIGFTLVESLVALVIASIGLLSAIKVFTMISSALEKTKKQNYALISSQNVMQQAFLRFNLPPELKESKDCSQGNLKLRCELTVFRTSHPNFNKLEVKVLDASGNILVREIAFKGEQF